MVQTVSSGLVIPEVFGASVQAEFVGRSVMRTFSTLFTELEGQPGDKLSLVEFANLTDLAADAVETTALTPEALTSTATSMTIKEAAKAIEVTDRAQLTAFSDTVGEGARQIAEIITRRVDTHLRDAAYTAGAGRTVTPGTAMNYAAVLAGLAKFGDGAANQDISLIVHSAQWLALMNDDKFVSATDNDGVTAPGYVGTLAGIVPVFMTDRLAVVDGGEAPDTYKALLIKGRPLAFGQKRSPEVETQRDILKRVTYVSSSLHYVTGLIRADRVAILVTE